MEPLLFQKMGNADDFLVQKRMEIMLESFNKKVANELSSIYTLINNLNAELCEVKKYISEVKGMVIAAPAVADSSKGCMDKAKNKKEDAPKPRTGNYTPEDVSVEKFFYFGSKPK